MKFSAPLISGVLRKRYKRFLADVQLDTGELVTAHCPNTGSMLGCNTPGSRVWLSISDNPKRKYAYTWEMVEARPDSWVGINTGRANGLILEAIQHRKIDALQEYASVRTEVRYGQENSRIDIFLEQGSAPDAYVEVKNVTAIAEPVTDGKVIAIFPDAVSDRGSKHLRELMQVVAEGKRGVLCFCIQRSDAQAIRPAFEIDPVYADTLEKAIQAGVEVMAYRFCVTPISLELDTSIPVCMKFEEEKN